LPKLKQEVLPIRSNC